MNPIQLEAWVRDVCARATQGKPAEDSRVELKRTWPDPKKAARRIAGHANASRGAEVMWLIGVDERGCCLTGANGTELSTWWSQVQAEFDDGCPRLVDSVVVVDGVPVVALLFDTSGGPFVVRIAMGDGGVDREVPWREGTSVRTARRSDLVRLLAPLTLIPDAELLKCSVFDSTRIRGGEIFVASRGDGLQAQVEIYFTPRDSGQVVIPFHRVSASLEMADGSFVALDQEVEFLMSKATKIAHVDPSSLVLDGPAMATLMAVGSVPREPFEIVRFEARFLPVGSQVAASVVCVLTRRSGESWGWGSA